MESDGHKQRLSGNEQHYLGIDIGGTKVSAGIVNAHGEIISSVKGPMNTEASASDGLLAVKSVVDEVLRANGTRPLAGIGVSSPGQVDPYSGIVRNAVNLPCWADYPLRSEMQRTSKLPVWVDNDANAAGLAEAIWGAAAEYDSVFYASIGTGIGTAVVQNRSIYRGPTGAAGEGGHMSIDYRGDINCNCGKPGCIESMAAGPGIARRARVQVASNVKRGRALLNIAKGDVSAITSESVGRGWKLGDPVSTTVLMDTAVVLAAWMGNIIDLFEPQVIVLGGGLGELISNFFEEIRRQLPKYTLNKHCGQLPMKLARYGPDSGIAGGAALCLRASNATVCNARGKQKKQAV